MAEQADFRETPWGIAMLRVMGWLAAIPYLLVVVLVLTGGPSWSSVGYLVGIGVLVFGLLSLPGTERAPALRKPFAFRPRGVCRVAFGVLVLVAFVRIETGANGTGVGGEVGSTTTRHSRSVRYVDRLLDESDVARSGARVLFATGQLRDDGDEVPRAMTKLYAEMRAAEGDHPSPVVATYLGMQSPSAFDVVTYDPNQLPERNVGDVTDAVIFLHGFAGNFTLPCWQIARAVVDLNVLTVCPSTNWIGDWSTEEGEAILRQTITDLHARGIKRIVLAGLSNGGIGASHLAPKLGHQLNGLVLISGADPSAKKVDGVPTLVIHGKKDSMVEYGAGQKYAVKNGAELVALDAAHFAMLVRRTEFDAAFHRFVAGVFASAKRPTT